MTLPRVGAKMWRLPLAGLLLGGLLSAAVIGGAEAGFHHGTAPRPVQDAFGYLRDETQPAGTPLPNGLSVPTGARMLGAVFAEPQPGETDTQAWSATFVLTANPAVALRALVEQLRAGVAPNGTLGCEARSANGEGWGIGGRHRPPAGVGPPVWIDCELSAAGGAAAAATPGQGASVEATLSYGRYVSGTPSDATLSMRVLPGAGGSPVSAGGLQHPLRPHVPALPTFLSPPRPVPQPGDLTFRHTVAPLTVAEGSQPVAAASLSGFVARVTGDPGSVFNAYVRELEARGGGTASVTSGTSPYGEWRSATVDNGSDEGDGRLMMVTNGDGSFIETSVT